MKRQHRPRLNTLCSKKLLAMTKPENRSLKRKTFLAERDSLCSKRWTNLNEAKFQRIHENGLKQHVVVHDWNQSKRMNTNRARCLTSTKKLKFLGQNHDEVLLTTDRRHKDFKANEDRIIFKDGPVFQKYHTETSSVQYYQKQLPKQPIDEVILNLHGEIDIPESPGQ